MKRFFYWVIVIFLVATFIIRIDVGSIYLNFGFLKIVSAMINEDTQDIERANYYFNGVGKGVDLYQDVQRGKGFALFLQRDISGATNAWKNINPDNITTLVMWLYEQKEYGVSIDLLETALEKYPSSPHRLEWWHELAGGFSADKKWDKVIAVAQRGLLEFPDDAELLFVLGRTLYTRNQDVNEAEKLIKQAITQDEKFAQAYAWMGHMMAAENRFSDAYDWYRRADELEPSRSWLLLQANMARGMQDFPLAVTLYNEIIEKYANDEDAYYELAWAYLLTGQIDMAVDAIEQALRYAPANGRYYFRARKIIEQIQNPNEVMDVCLEISEINPNNPLINDGICR